MLWEIHRLRAIALRTNQLFERLVELGIESKLDPATKLLTEGLSDALRGEPAVTEAEAARQALLELFSPPGRGSQVAVCCEPPLRLCKH